MGINPPTGHELTSEEAKYIASPYLDDVNDVKNVITAARQQGVEPDVSNCHPLAVNAVDPKLLTKDQKKFLKGGLPSNNRDNEPGVSHIQQAGDLDWRIEAGQKAPMSDLSEVPPGHLDKEDVARIYEKTHVNEPSIQEAIIEAEAQVTEDNEPGQINVGANPPEVQSQVQQDLDDPSTPVKELEKKPEDKIAKPAAKKATAKKSSAKKATAKKSSAKKTTAKKSSKK